MLAGIGLGNMVQNMLGLSIIIGLNSASCTFISHALGSKSYKLSENYLKRGKIMILYGMVPVIAVTLFSDTILTKLGQNKDVALQARYYSVACLPGIILSGLNDL
jgi:Na+-driven multidrug efflux pump